MSSGAESAILSFLNKVVQIVFLAMSFVPSKGSGNSRWINYAMAISGPTATALMLLIRENYYRLREYLPESKLRISWLDRIGCT